MTSVNSKEDEQITRAAGIVGLATLASRVLGAVRDILFASFFGAAMISDAFIAAFRLPNLLRRLFGEGSLSVALVPVFTDSMIHDGPTEARRMVSSLLRLCALALSLITVPAILFAPQLVRILSPGFAQFPDKFDLTVQLTRVMMPYGIFVGLVAICMGILNVMGHFTAPALAPVLLNLAMIGAMLAGRALEPGEKSRVIWLAAAVIVGGGWQLALQIPCLVRYRIIFWRRSPWCHPRFGQLLLLMGPMLFGAAVYQINSLVITLLATMLSQGSVSHLYYADRLVQLPLGIFGIATATAVLPALSRQVAAGQWAALRQTFAHALQLVCFISLPAMAGLIVLRTPIVALLFQRGAFDAQATRLTAGALLYYGIGLWSFAAVRIVLNLFFALKDTRTPVWIAALAVLANLVLGAALMKTMGTNGLALALSLASVFHLALLIGALRKRTGALGWRKIAFSIGRSILCTAVMAIVLHGLAHWLLPTATGVDLLAGVTICILAGSLIFIAMAYALRAPELHAAINAVFKRTGVK